MPTTIKPVAYAGWPKCYSISNGETELIVTTDVGPRIIRYAFINGQNLFVEVPGHLGKSGEPWWMMRGGHRLWIAPEIKPDTYALDNAPVQATIHGGAITLLQPIEPETGLRKEISLEYTPTGAVKVTHRIINCSKQSRRLAAWALSQMATGGLAIVPFPPRAGHSEQLLPTNPLSMWAYTNFADKRWQFTYNYLTLRQDQTDSTPQKTGLFNANTRAAYLLNSELFIKRAQADPTAQYPDYGCSLEIFTNNDFLELETLGPLTDLAPESSVEHVEHWSLHRGIQLPVITDKEIDRVIQPLF